MFTLIKNETYKLLKRPKTIVVMVCFLLLMVIAAFSNYSNAKNMKKFNDPEYQISNNEKQISYLNDRKSNTKISDSEKKDIDAQISSLKEENAQLEQNKNVKVSWRDNVQKRIDELKGEENSVNIDKEDTKMQIAVYQKLLDKNIPLNDGTKVTSISFMNTLFNVIGTLFLLVGVIIFTVDIVSGEYTPATMKFLLTQPVSRGKVLLSKFITAVVSSIVIITILELIAFVVVGFIFGFGNLNYPTVIGGKYVSSVLGSGQDNMMLAAGSAHIVTAGQSILYMLLLQAAFIIATVAFAILMSTVLKSSMVSVTAGIVIGIVLTIIQVMPFARKIAPYLFTVYGDVGASLSGNIARSYNNTNFSVISSIVVMAVWSVLCYVISHVVFVKKDLLI